VAPVPVARSVVRVPRSAPRSSALLAVCAAYAAFGMPVAILGAGWPDGREIFDQPSSSMGVLAMAYGLGRLATSPTGQLILRRRRIGSAASGLLVLLAATQVVVAVTTSFVALVASIAVVGLVSGALDSLGNRYQTVVRQVRHAGLMFGAYGIGATVGPALVALTSWRTAFLGAAGVSALAAVVNGSRSVAWPTGIESPVVASTAGAPTPAASVASNADAEPAERPRVPAGPLALSLLCFALYCALEVATGAWTASYFEEHRGASARWAGLAVSGFWAGVTLSRLAMTRIDNEPRRILAVGAAVVAGSYLAVPLLPTPGAIAAVAVAGAALAVMLPTLVVTTGERVGAAATPRVTGYQLLAANLGGTGFSAGLGVIVARTGDGAPGWALAAVGLMALPVLHRALALHPAAPATDRPSDTGTHETA
jgi:fucose permease